MSQQRPARVSFSDFSECFFSRIFNIHYLKHERTEGIDRKQSHESSHSAAHFPLIFHFPLTRRRAKLILRKKKYQENLLKTTDNELEALEKLTADLEFSQVQQQVLDGLKIGNDALKKIHDVLTIEEVEKIMDETREGVEKQQELDALISSGVLSLDDENSVAAELEELIASTLPHIDDDIDEKLPDVPSHEPAPAKEKKRIEERPDKVALEA